MENMICLILFRNPNITVLQLTKLLGHFTSTIQAILATIQATVPVYASGTNKDIPVEKFSPNNIDIRFACSRETTVVEKQNLFINRQITNSATTAKKTIQMDAPKTGWEVFTNGLKTVEFQNIFHQYSGTESNLFDPTDFHLTKNATVYLQIDNISALTYLLKMGGTQNLEIINISKENWMYLGSRNISITGSICLAN